MAIKLEITMTNKWLYSLIAVGIFLALGVGVWAYNSDMRAGNPPVMGHSAGEIHVEDSSGNIVSLQDALDDNLRERILLDSPIVIFNGNGGGTGTLDILDTSLPPETSEVLLYGTIDDGNDNNYEAIKYKHPSHNTWKNLVLSNNGALYPNTNSVWVPLENGELDWIITDASELQDYRIEIQGYK